MRLSNSFNAIDNLVMVTIEFEKIPRRKAYLIKRVVARRLLVKDFREVLGDLAFRVANDMISGIHSIISRTVEALQSDANVLLYTKREWETLNGTLIE